MNPPAVYTINIDGAARGNPGPAAFAYVISADGTPTIEESGCLGHATNNVAEYTALGRALRWLRDRQTGPVTSLTVRGDSQLVVKQMTGEWTCRKPHLARLRDRCRELAGEIGVEPRYDWVPREENAEADALAREAYTRATGKPFPEHPERRR